MNRSELPIGEIWAMSQKQVKRFDGSFADYKKIIKKKIDSVETAS
jgi:hypothetical protein